MKKRCSILLLLCFLLTGCSMATSGGRLISAAEGSEVYSTVLESYLSGYTLWDGADTLYAEVAQGNTVA